MGTLIQYCPQRARKYSTYTDTSWPAAGMGYLIQTEGGHWIAIDGGWDREDAEGLLSIMERMSQGRPSIDLWIITHPHDDHIGAMDHLANDPALCARVSVKLLCFSLAPVEMTPWDTYSPNRLLDVVKRMNLPVYTPHEGDELEVDGYHVKFYFTWENYGDLMAPNTTYNSLSLIFKITGSRRTAMFLGDSTEVGPRYVQKKYRYYEDELKSDIVQVAHHGLDGGDAWFYRDVGASIVLIPNGMGGGEYEKKVETASNVQNRYAQERAYSVMQAFCGTMGIEF